MLDFGNAERQGSSSQWELHLSPSGLLLPLQLVGPVSLLCAKILNLCINRMGCCHSVSLALPTAAGAPFQSQRSSQGFLERWIWFVQCLGYWFSCLPQDLDPSFGTSMQTAAGLCKPLCPWRGGGGTGWCHLAVSPEKSPLRHSLTGVCFPFALLPAREIHPCSSRAPGFLPAKQFPSSRPATTSPRPHSTGETSLTLPLGNFSCILRLASFSLAWNSFQTFAGGFWPALELFPVVLCSHLLRQLGNVCFVLFFLLHFSLTFFWARQALGKVG